MHPSCRTKISSRANPEPAKPRFALRAFTEPGPAQSFLICRHEANEFPAMESCTYKSHSYQPAVRKCMSYPAARCNNVTA